MIQSDPYLTNRSMRRFGNPMGMAGGSGSSYGSGGGSPSYPMQRRQRLPILPDMSGASATPAGAATSSGAAPQAVAAREADQARSDAQQQQTNAQNLQARNANAAAGAAQQAASIDAYRKARDNGPQMARDRQQTQIAQSLGIDPSADLHTIANAESGPTRFDANGMPIGADTQQSNLNPTGPAPASTPTQVQPNQADVRDAALTIQAQRSGAQRTATDDAYAAGRGGSPTGADPFAKPATPDAAMPPMPGLTLNGPTPATAPPPPSTPTPDATGTPANPVAYNPGKSMRRKPLAAGAAVSTM